MTSKLLSKGLEIELFVGKKSGEVIPSSGFLKEQFPEISQEPDQRNFEYITNPTTSYDELTKEIIVPRIKYRNYLKEKDNLTILPCSTIPLSFDKQFHFSEINNPYHQYIGNTYGTKVVTTSLHLNFGIENKEAIFKLLSALRLDTPLFLALSASSCFHDGKLTDYNSFRWYSFPKTPKFIPLFQSHEEYINWVNDKINKKEMFNVRHQWNSLRPNGPNRPYDLNRIEIRICDFIADIEKSLSVIALIELMIIDYLTNESWPTILKNKDLTELAISLDKQEELSAKNGLNAKIHNWRNDSEDSIHKIIENLYVRLLPLSKELNINSVFNPILKILENGNDATQFIQSYNNNLSIEKTIQHFTEQFYMMDLKAYNSISYKIN